MQKNAVKEWKFNGKTYAIGRVNEKEKSPPPYLSFEDRSYNCIFEVIDGFWKKNYKVLLREEIPQQILIDIGCFGTYDSKNWQPQIFKIAEEQFGMPVEKNNVINTYTT